MATTPEKVLSSLMNDGTFDSFKTKIMNKIKSNRFFLAVFRHVSVADKLLRFSFPDELKNNTINMVQQSKALNTPGAEKMSKKELFEALRRELEAPVLEKASKFVWELILDMNGVGKEINEMVETQFWRLSGRDPPETSSGQVQGQPETSSEPCQDDKNTSMSVRKRTFSAMDKSTENSSIHHASVNNASSIPQQNDGAVAGSSTIPPGTVGYCAVSSNSSVTTEPSAQGSVTADFTVPSSSCYVNNANQGSVGHPLPISATGPTAAIPQCSGGGMPLLPPLPSSTSIHSANSSGIGYGYMATTLTGLPYSAVSVPAHAASYPANLVAGHVMPMNHPAPPAHLMNPPIPGHSFTAPPAAMHPQMVNGTPTLLSAMAPPNSGQLMGPMVAQASSYNGHMVTPGHGNPIMPTSMTGYPHMGTLGSTHPQVVTSQAPTWNPGQFPS